MLGEAKSARLRFPVKLEQKEIEAKRVVEVVSWEKCKKNFFKF